MKKINPSYFYIFAFVVLSQPSYAQIAESGADQPAKISLPKLTPPALMLTPVMTSSAMPELPPAKLPKVYLAPELACPSNFVIVMVDGKAHCDVKPAEAVAPTPVIVAKKEIQAEVLSGSELAKLGVKLSFNDLNAELKGSLPAACVNNLVMDVVKRGNDSDEDSDEIATSAKKISSVDDLERQSSRIGVRVIYKGNEKLPTLDECIAAEQGNEYKELASSGKLSKSILSDSSEYARMGFMDSKGNISLGDKSVKTASYRKLLKVLKFKDCADCQINASNIEDAVVSVEGQAGVSEDIKMALLEKGMVQFKEHLDAANSIASLRDARSELLGYAKMIRGLHIDANSHQQMMKNIEDQFAAIQMKTGDVAKSDAAHTGKYADLIAETGLVAGTFPGLSKDFRDQQKLVHGAYAKGGSNRLEFVAAIDPSNIEVREFLNGEQILLHNAQQAVNKNCRNMRSNACQQSIAQMQAIQKQAESLATKFMSAQLPQATAQNSFGTTGAAAPQGAIPLSSMSSMNLMSNMNTLNPSIYPNAIQYNVNGQSMYQTSAPSYQPSVGSQYMIANPTVAVPLSQALNPAQASASIPQYSNAI